MKRGTIIIENNAVHVIFVENTVWLSQHQIAALFDCFVSKVNSNLRSIFRGKLLLENEVMQTHRFEGGSVDLYNLEMITALAFRIPSEKAATFRHWTIKRMAVKSHVLPPIVLHCNENTILC